MNDEVTKRLFVASVFFALSSGNQLVDAVAEFIEGALLVQRAARRRVPVEAVVVAREGLVF